MFVTTREILYSALRAVQPFMSNDVTRRHLSGVRIEFADGDCHLIATDGAALAHVQLVCPIGERAPSDGWGFLTGEQVKRAIAQVKPAKAERGLLTHITCSGADITIDVKSDETIHTTKHPRADVQDFPPWRQVVPPREHVKKPAAFVGLGGWQLERAGKACKAFLPTGVDRGFVVRTPELELNPVRLDTDHPDRGSLTVVIMPMRV
jgi:hypothetical protein